MKRRDREKRVKNYIFIDAALAAAKIELPDEPLPYWYLAFLSEGFKIYIIIEKSFIVVSVISVSYLK